MKTFLLPTNIFSQLLLILFLSALSVSVNAQTYNSIKNGAWNNAATWEGGVIPPVNGSIIAGMQINIKHRVSYSGSNINNEGIINISNPNGPSPRLLISSGINLTNKSGGTIIILDAEMRQYRFIGGKESGLPQSGNFKNDGGTLKVNNSFVEFAEDWSNEGGGTSYFRNSSLAIGKNYDLKNYSKDTILFSSISVGMLGSGDFTVDGGSALAIYNALRVQVASPGGKFNLKSGIVSGSIDHVSLLNHVTGLYSVDKIIADNSIITAGIVLNSYRAPSALSFVPNGKFTGTKTLNNALKYFPAKLLASASSSAMNMTEQPVLVSGTPLQVGAKYQYDGIAPGIDAYVTIDSLVNGAVINNLDDNANGSGFTEGFQPQITSGAVIGESYVKLKFEYFVSGTNDTASVSDLTLTTLDIDGTSTYKEFNEIHLGPGATASYVAGSPGITLTEPEPGTFRGINANGMTINGVDTTAKYHMFTVTRKGVSSFTVKMGIVNTQPVATYRLFSFYAKGFVYPVMGTLPVKMESFTAQLNNGFADLAWTTSSEKDVSHFAVERSMDGKSFTNQGIVYASGNSSELIHYNFSDKNINTAKPGIIYYRIRSVDIDGKSELSVVRMITIGNQNKQAVIIIPYPNPVTNDLHITIPANWQGKKVTYELLDNNGRATKRKAVASANQTESINVASLTSGMYIVRVICSDESAHQKVIKR
jgi:Secretion system C-terminal sorting domain